jgi:F0F1-type ATP synthase assembly protein I
MPAKKNRRNVLMMSLLFLLFLAVMILALSDKETLSFKTFGVAIILSTFWFLHHATSSLEIQL